MRHIKIAIILEAAGNSTRFGSNKLMHIMDDGQPMISGILNAARETAEKAADGRLGESVHAAAEISLILVTQYEDAAQKAKEIWGSFPFTIVRNSRPDLGISHSMQLGIEAAEDADAYMFCVCDQPGLKASTIEKLIRTFIAEGLCCIQGPVSSQDSFIMPEKGIAAEQYRIQSPDCSRKNLNVPETGIGSECIDASECDAAEKQVSDRRNNLCGIVSLAWKGQMRNPKIFSSGYKDELMSLSGDTGGRQIIAAHMDELLLVEAGSEEEILDIDYHHRVLHNALHNE